MHKIECPLTSSSINSSATEIKSQCVSFAGEFDPGQTLTVCCACYCQMTRCQNQKNVCFKKKRHNLPKSASQNFVCGCSYTHEHAKLHPITVANSKKLSVIVIAQQGIVSVQNMRLQTDTALKSSSTPRYERRCAYWRASNRWTSEKQTTRHCCLQ